MDRLEGLDIVQDISPALEATEDFIQCLEGISDQSHDIHSLRQTQQLYDVKLSNRGVWSQPEVGPLSFAWADHQPPSAISILGQSMGLKHAKKSRAHSTNDLAAHSKDFSSNISNSVFRKGHSRSRSDVNYRSSAFTDNGLHTVDFSTPKNMGLNAKRGAHKETRSAIVVKQAAMQQREGPWRRWAPCHLELTPCELRLYTLDSSANHQLGIAYSLSHCKSVISPAPTIQLCQGDQPQSSDPCTLQAVFFNSTLLELRADSQSEAIEWKRLMWEKVLATRPPKQKQVMTTSCEKNTSVAKFHKATCSWSSSEVYPRSDHDNDDTIQAGISPSIMNRPTALPLFTQHSQDILKVGLLHLLTEQNKWRAFTFVLTQSVLQAFLTEGMPVSQPVFWYHLTTCLGVQHDQDPENVDPKNRSQTDPDIFFKTIFSKEVLLLRAESRLKAQSWVEILRKAVELQKPSQTDDDTPRLKGVLLRSRVSQERRRRDDQQEKRQSVTTSFLSILACLAVEKGLTAQNFKCAGCLHQMGLSRGKAKVCCYSGWYYCTSCHQDNTFIIPARLLHNWDTGKHKVSKQAKEFLEFVYEEPLLDVQQLNPCLYGHCEPLSVVLHLRQQLQSLRAYLFSCRAAVAEDLRRRIFPREYLLQHIHLYSIADLQQVIDGKLAPFLSKVIKFASSHVFSCSQCREKGFICELCKNGKVIYPFQESGTKRCKGCGAVFHAECHQKAQPCPRCVRRELNTRPSSFWCNEDDDDVPGCYQDP